VVGVGSVGTRCTVLLLTDIHDQPLFLQVKQATPSALAPYVAQGNQGIRHEGERVVSGQRLMQAASDSFLGWVSATDRKYHLYLRQLRDMKVSFDTEAFDEFLLGRYAVLCCRTLARAHARAGGLAAQVSGYLGKNGEFAEAMVAYANAYADQVERDFRKFRTACRKERLTAQTEADFAADWKI
jgi:uncharacterized protein (DUF2252 family)